MYCPNCGTQNADNDKFCVRCGTALPSIQPQTVPLVKPQLVGMACHYPGCAEPVIGQCPGYQGSCLRFYCATHSIEPYCSVCAEKIARDAAINAIYEDYLQAARKVPTAIGWGTAFLIWVFLGIPFTAMISMSSSETNTPPCVLTTLTIVTVLVFLLMRWTQQYKRDAISKISAEKPGFSEFYAEYEKQKNSYTMATVLTGLLAAGAAAKAIDDYRMRQDIRALVKGMKK